MDNVYHNSWPRIQDPQERGEILAKQYASVQARIDSDEEYKQAIIRARKESIKRVAETGWISATDEFLENTFIMTMDKDKREGLFSKPHKVSDMLSFISGNKENFLE